MNYINKALEIAVKAHSNQLDKGGNPYIFHPIRVALNCQTEEEKIVALLHDVIEDTDTSIEQLEAEGFSKEILESIISLTKKEGEDYMSFIKRVATNRTATNVKLQDLADNMDTSRLNGKKHWKYETYQQATEYLKSTVLHDKNQEPR